MNYVALTLGPIVEVLQNSKKTRELWAGSYLFSYFMKTMIIQMKGTGYDFLSPAFEEALLSLKNGVGLFHDRLIACSEKKSEVIERETGFAIHAAKENLAEIIVSISPARPEKKTNVLKFLDQYLQISYIITPLDNGVNVFETLNSFLDNAELQRTFLSRPGRFNIFDVNEEGNGKAGKKWLDPISYLQFRVNSSALKKDAFKDTPAKGFPSIAEIAGKDLQIIQDDKSEDPFPEGCKLKYKYAAIIQADGDNVGQLIKQVGKHPDAAREFSKKLFSFASEVSEISGRFGAEVIYAGGDDVLSFAPIIYNGKTVFDYMDSLNTRFKEIMGGLRYEEAGKLSLSFGVTAVYYKYPLYEALEQARNNLFGEAKKFTLNSKKPKNAVVLELIKHSGQSMKNIFLQTDEKVYARFKKLLASELDETTSIPHALQHNLQRSEKLITTLSRRSDFSERLADFFENNFNERVHGDSRVKKGLLYSRELLEGFFAFYGEEKNPAEIFSEFFSALSIIKHLRGDR